MTQPAKEYHVRIGVKLSDDILPVPALSKDELRAYLVERLNVGDPAAPIVSCTVSDPSERSPRRRY